MKNNNKRIIILFSIIIIGIFCLGSINNFNKDKINDSNDAIAASDTNLYVSTNIVGGVKLEYTNLVGGKILSDIDSIKSFKCNNKLSAGFSCSVKVKATAKSGYKFKGWSETSTCTKFVNSGDNYNIIFNENDNKKMYACVEKTNSGSSISESDCSYPVYESTGSSKLILSVFNKVTGAWNGVPECGKAASKSKLVSTKRCYIASTCKTDGTCDTYLSKYSKCGASASTPSSPVTKTSTLTITSENGATITINNNSAKLSTNLPTKKVLQCSNSSCSVTVTANITSGYTFKGWSKDNCKNIASSSTKYQLSFSSDATLTACTTKNTTTTTKTTSTTKKTTTKSNKGNTIVTEPTVPVNNQESINKYVYAKGSEYGGNSISCGDKIYVTTCSSSVCNVTSINGKNVSTTTQIKKSNYVNNESDTGCFQNITRYIGEKSYYYTNSNLTNGKTEIGCGEKVIFTKPIETACSGGSCGVEFNGKTIYVSKSLIVNDKPVCNNTEKCVTSNEVYDLKQDINVKICKNDDTEEKRNTIVTCATDYEYSYNLVTNTCDNNNSDDCYKEYKYTCNYIKRPGISASAGIINSNGIGTINITGYDYGNVGLNGYYISSGNAPTENSNWNQFSDSNYTAIENKTAGTYFVWSINKKSRISNSVLVKVYDADLSTTLKKFNITDASGNDLPLKGLDNNTTAYNGEIKDGKYALLSNDLLSDSNLGIFDALTTSYEVNTTSNKIAIYATLTSDDANFVEGYEPKTIDLDYGRNVALIKIVNKNGRERTYTFIINRVDDRNNSNYLKKIKLSKGSIDFDKYTSNYEVSIPKNTKVVSINAELESDTASFIKGYEPREVQITESVQSALIKVKGESGNIRSYVITFVKNGSIIDNDDSVYLSSLTVPGTQIGFDKDTFDYTITVPYETEDVPIYAFAESQNAVVNISNNLGLSVGNNLIEIEVKNDNKVKVYSLHVIRKESGLDISNSAKLGLLSIKNYNINFNPDILDYTVKIKREKNLLITASPESNRADIYMYGNNDLTGFSTVRVKVIAENGLTNIYSIDIEKATYNKTVEIISAAIVIIVVSSLSVYLITKNRKKTKKEYLEG